MKGYFLLEVFTFLAILLSQVHCQPTFSWYVTQFNKTYTEEQYEMREKIFNTRVTNFASITDYTPGVNQLTDWTDEQIAALKNLRQTPVEQRVSSAKLGSKRLGAPLTLDWRTEGYVTRVKNQGNCGSCWAFAADALVESFLVMLGKQDISIDLSEQKLVQCTRNSNCDGGYVQNALQVIKQSAPTQSQFPYQESYGTLGGDICSAGGIQTNYQAQYYYDISDSQLIELLQQGPVALALSADNWQYYSSGIFSCSSYPQINHAVLAVGYTSSAIIIKNSWGTRWGMNGYIYVSRGINRNCRIGYQVFGVSGWQIFGVTLPLLLILTVFIII